MAGDDTPSHQIRLGADEPWAPVARVGLPLDQRTAERNSKQLEIDG